jgi:hypothetical protein
MRAGFHRSLPGKLSAAVWTQVRDEVRHLLGRRPSLCDDARMLPGMATAIQRGIRSRVARDCRTGI